ncbi:DUF6282 family protein [Dyadobacter sp. LJ53]|uniref:DUF6282 family protein n=1 Tax=Dyadobacter chenwenxiniae TaxID=2906456 RepID=UPI001F47FBA8|nr:DUF6282 family protein [Dyadobacter chenwenxiniae]MCF0051690.1 DUF6282 family protein [Dyadobacter chenwenxiniae]
MKNNLISKPSNLRQYFAAILLLLTVSGSVSAQDTRDSILIGTIDTHIHTEEEYAILEGGSMDMVDLAKRARDKGMRAIVIKSLKFETATRAYLTHKQVPGIEVYGGLTLDMSVGGMNAEAVRAMASLKLPNAKMVWMPALDSKAGVIASGQKRDYVVVSENGKLTPATLAVLDTVAKYGFSLATSHLGADEALLIVRAARQRNITVVVTHATQQPVLMSVAQMKEAANLGAYIEHTAFGDFKGPQSHFFKSFYKNQPRVEIKKVAQYIKEVGAEHTILATDLGQAFSPTPPDGLKWFMMSLLKEGITPAQIDLMTRVNPAKLLHLEPAPSK